MSDPGDWRVVKLLAKQRYLFVSLLLLLLIGPIAGFGNRPGAHIAMYGALAMVFITGPLAASRGRISLYFSSFLGVCLLLFGMYTIVVGEMYPAAIGLGGIFFAFLAGLVLRDLLFVSNEVDEETLWMAVNVYLLIGLVFAFTYAIIAFFEPAAFVGKFMDQPLRDQLYGFIYFSFVTMTTLGYGDLTPNNTFVGTLAYMEALIGQLYVAIMIARLVGLHIVRRVQD